MNLTFEIVSPNGQSLGPARRKVFGPEGGRIGRSPDCDWVLPSPYISRHHATIRWISGTYYIESTGENGVAIGTSQAIIPKLERRPLRHGDHVFIDEYELLAALESSVGEAAPAQPRAVAAGAFAPEDDPFDLGPTRSSPAPVDPLDPTAEDLDPLKRFGGPGSAGTHSPRQEPGWNHTPGISDHFAVPPPAAAIASEPAIPPDWDRTHFSRSSGAASAPPPSAPIPDDWDEALLPSKPSGASAGPPPAAISPPAPARVGPQGTRMIEQSAAASRAPPPIPTPRPNRPISGGPHAAPPRSGAPSPVVPPAPKPQAPGVSGSGGTGPAATAAAPQQSVPAGFDVAALLKSAGVDPASLPPETAGSLGQILRSVVQGVIDVLRARAEIKEQFRLSHTMVKTTENNPLKFAVDAEDALSSLLGRRNPAYLPPVEAFEDAFNDIRFHQLAMLAGMRAGFDHVMSRFDPEQLQESFDKRARRGGLLSMSGRARYWEQFQEQFQELAGDREQAFRRLFAEEFAAAYEKQLELLKRSHGKMKR